MRVVIALVAASLFACASGKKAGEGTDAPIIEDAPGPVADAPPDGPPKKGFGEPCTGNAQCESEVCILVGTTGQCTEFCVDDCPKTYGCLGVEGIVIEGQVSFVCVPTSNQLCTTCTDDTECTLIGMDKCLTYPDGDRACGRDCTDVSCPTGYQCNTVDIGGLDYRQCMAESAACDCTAATTGATQTCNITTPWNVCVGAQTCAGAGGWGDCEPPSPVDDPDENFVDSNCDGIDGDLAKAVFVSVAGANTGTCGLTYQTPCQTITFALARAQATARTHVYVQSGSYTETITMVNGISIFGGYDFNWRRNTYAMTGHTVTITSTATTAVRFENLTQPTWLDDVIVRSAASTATGGSSIAVLVRNSQAVELRGVSLQPGSGGAGNAGSDGGVGADGGDGGTGTPGCEDSSGTCSSCSRPPGGLAGVSTCSRPGGVGGLPGHENAGGLAGGTPTNGAAGGAGATCGGNRNCDGTVGTTGLTGSAGDNGTGGTSFGFFSGTTYAVANGSDGFTGSGGQGGGGGGGGGGGDEWCDSYGSSGGGGGAGGCGGGRGTRGTGGGGSFGVIAENSLVVIASSQITAGSGGAGGRGGTGGGGGDGGSFGAGGGYGGSGGQDDGGDGARGGNGGRGGRGGDGGGGGGGPSFGVVCLGSSGGTVSAFGSTILGGSGGAGGASLAPGSTGMSAPTFGCSF